MKEQLKRLLSGAFYDARAAGRLPATIDLPVVELQVPRDATHGDLATNVAMTLAKTAGMPPRAIAEVVLAHLRDPTGLRESSSAN